MDNLSMLVQSFCQCDAWTSIRLPSARDHTASFMDLQSGLRFNSDVKGDVRLGWCLTISVLAHMTILLSWSVRSIAPCDDCNAACVISREAWIGAVSCFLVEWWTCRHCMDDLGIILAFQITFIVLSRLDFDYCCVFFYFRERSMGNTCKAITHSNALYPGGLLQSTPMLPPTPHNISLCWRACGMNSVLDNSRSKGYQSPPPWHALSIDMFGFSPLEYLRIRVTLM